MGRWCEPASDMGLRVSCQRLRVGTMGRSSGPALLTSAPPPPSARADHLQPSADACCQACRSLAGCNAWVWCGAAEGCAQKSRPKGECWLKKADNSALAVYNWADVRASSVVPPQSSERVFAAMS